jgi:hypothetical protein
VSDRDAIPNPLESMIRAVAGERRGNDPRTSTFARGLALGALVGAAIAGSTIWQRRRLPPRAIGGSGSRGSEEPRD